ncbi:transmembrane protein 94-like [Limulus polyphemus]|uniref:Transmembrane protein 94-like n=1 Tax=Limulus polyphemus TaxID=6850 RepID=A0ABM1TB97_LIMPO|nr:transmembrane protein 94-like [Limulus polyphemus]
MGKYYRGLTTPVALKKLHDDMKNELERWKHQCTSKQGVRKWLIDAYHHTSAYSTFRWPSAALLAFGAIIFLVCYGLSGTTRSFTLVIESFFLLLLLVTNTYLVGWDAMLRQREMLTKGETLLAAIRECMEKQKWTAKNYPHLHMPQSPCISLQWTHRDGQLVNLPCCLLVAGDVVTLRPGHHAPAHCCCVEEELETVELSAGEIYAPATQDNPEVLTTARLRAPLPPAKFQVLETPYAAILRGALEESLDRPVSFFNKERHGVVLWYLEAVIIPCVLLLTVVVKVLSCVYLERDMIRWPEIILLHPVVAILPLLPVTLPVCWLLLNCSGTSRLFTMVQLSKSLQPKPKELDPFEETEDVPPPMSNHSPHWSELLSNGVDLLLGRKGHLWRSANLLQVLGSITALCCIDKKGILSWPNPTAEKVFFLKSFHPQKDMEDKTYFSSTSIDGEVLGGVVEPPGDENVASTPEYRHLSESSMEQELKEQHMYHPGNTVEVLDLTHNANSAFGLEFDDPKWKIYITNLKPLGLGILLNTCNPDAQEHYSHFCDHIACESLNNSAAVPVVNKRLPFSDYCRCLCELASQIGFTEGATNVYQLQQQLAVFRHVRPEVIQKGRLARSLNFPRLKMPFPNMACAVVRDLHSGSYQLFSQGTADLLLDACSEYWDGRDLCILMESDRKRILDFYQRSSLTAYCMAFAYSPLSQLTSSKFDEVYVELPPDSSHLFPSVKNRNTIRIWDIQSVEGVGKPLVNHFLSTDSLFLKSHQEEHSSSDAATCLQQLSNEVFIGMVTMQYQACPDFVQLIEQLDKACIRFVHFSKENELRSRVFSEKMGLESGWNCHISLFSERCRSESGDSSCQQMASASTLRCKIASRETVEENGRESKISKPAHRCASAPSLVNLELSTVKFQEENSMYSDWQGSVSGSLDYRLHRLSNHLQNEKDEEDEEEECTETDPLNRPKTEVDIFLHETEDEDLGISGVDLSPQHSHMTESTEQSAPLTFDMSNRAKLPKGIENIRPHIERVDNVPLLVSLFTDCTAEATREMIKIMQEYGEVVCCIGSSASVHNMPVFLQADVSIGIEPLYPQLCMRQTRFEKQQNTNWISPTGLSHHLNTLPCTITYSREDPVSLFHVIMEARHFMAEMRNSFQFMLCCCLSLALTELLGALFFLPLPLPPGHILWLQCLIIPLLSFSLLGLPVDPHVMTIATGKNLKVVSKQGYLNVYQRKNLGSDSVLWQSYLILSQNILTFLLVFYFVVISIGFVHRSHLLHERNPFLNKCWISVSILVLLLQFIFCILNVALNTHEDVKPQQVALLVPSYGWIVGLVWPLVLLPVNEIVKRHEIKVNVRQQKRARLEFGTKLGMNSPF